LSKDDFRKKLISPNASLCTALKRALSAGKDALNLTLEIKRGGEERGGDSRRGVGDIREKSD
jgi:hypothetical protein